MEKINSFGWIGNKADRLFNRMNSGGMTNIAKEMMMALEKKGAKNVEVGGSRSIYEYNGRIYYVYGSGINTTWHPDVKVMEKIVDKYGEEKIYLLLGNEGKKSIYLAGWKKIRGNEKKKSDRTSGIGKVYEISLAQLGTEGTDYSTYKIEQSIEKCIEDILNNMNGEE